MIRKEGTREKDKEKKGMRVKIPAIEPIHCSKPLPRAYFSLGGHCVFGVCVYVCDSVSSGRGCNMTERGKGFQIYLFIYFPFGLTERLVLKKENKE